MFDRVEPLLAVRIVTMPLIGAPAAAQVERQVLSKISVRLWCSVILKYYLVGDGRFGMSCCAASRCSQRATPS